MRSLKLIGVLLDYPQDELWQHRAELLEAVDDPALSAPRRAALSRFVQDLLDAEPLDAQDRWLATFDRGRSMSLLLFEHIHGESRARGQAMVDLIEAYRRHGFELAARELPDYLPLLLEYLSQRPPEEGRDWLGHVRHILAMLAARALERNSPYGVLLEALVDLAEGTLDTDALRRRAREEERDDTPAAMDRLWEEEAVRFGAEASTDGCATPSRKPPAGAKAQVQP